MYGKTGQTGEYPTGYRRTTKRHPAYCGQKTTHCQRCFRNRRERQFRNNDSIKIIRKQVEKYKELVKVQVEKLERAKQNSEEAEIIKKAVELMKNEK